MKFASERERFLEAMLTSAEVDATGGSVVILLSIIEDVEDAGLAICQQLSLEYKSLKS
jgi:hypothetical protein